MLLHVYVAVNKKGTEAQPRSQGISLGLWRVENNFGTKWMILTSD